MTQLRIPAVYMRGGTSKGVFFLTDDLPADPVQRDKILLRVIGSPDPYGKHIDGMGGATSSTSKVVIINKSQRPDCDVDYLFGALSVSRADIDWSGNCGNLSAAVGPFAISAGLVAAPIEGCGWTTVRIWQANIGKVIVSHVQMKDGEVLEEGDFELDGVTFPAAEIKLEFLDPAADEGDGGAMFPTGHVRDTLDVPGVGKVEATLINAGLPTIFVAASSLGFTGTELQADINSNPELLARAEAVRMAGAQAMGIAATPGSHTPKIAFVAAPADYTASDGKAVRGADINLLARIFSMGPLHHAMTGTGAVAIATAVAIPGTLPAQVARPSDDGWVRFGHPSGTLAVGAEAQEIDGQWVVSKAMMSRSARRLMEGWVRVPAI